MRAEPPSAGGPTLELDQLLKQLVERAGAMMSFQSRMRDLIRINNDLTSNLDLPDVLHRIVETGLELVQARYGAIGVIGQGRRLEQFIHVGMDEETAARIGHLPAGRGLLGALIDDPQPVRLASIAADPRSSGFPPHHPPMETFIGVPIHVRGEIFGNLYLTDSRNDLFSPDDEELAQALAATAGVAIQNARLFADAQYRARWSTALLNVSPRLMLTDEGDELDAVVDRLPGVAEADLVWIGLTSTDGADLIVDRAAGRGADSLLSHRFSTAHTAAAKPLQTGEPLLIADSPCPADADAFTTQALLGNAMIVPFNAGDTISGVLCLARTPDKPPFTPRDLDMASSFAGHISLALGRSEVRLTRRRVALLEDRTRIARDLHDHVIQRLFATGLNLQATAAGTDDLTAGRIMAQIREIDGAIAQIRQSIFAIRRDADSTSSSLRARILEIVDRACDQLPNKPRVSFLGPVDLMTDAHLTDDVAAAVTEAVTNAVRHAHADHLEITVSAAAGRVTLEVVDDGVGPGDVQHLSGLGNLRARAEAREGTFEIVQAAGGGTHVSWSVPV